MSQPPDTVNPFDPFGTWRTARDAYLDTWSKAMIDLVNSEAYSDAMGRFLDSYLTISAPMRKVVEQSMSQVLAQLNMPSRQEVTTMAERLTNIEMRLDDLDAKLDRLQSGMDHQREPQGEDQSEEQRSPARRTSSRRGSAAARQQ